MHAYDATSSSTANPLKAFYQSAKRFFRKNNDRIEEDTHSVSKRSLVPKEQENKRKYRTSSAIFFDKTNETGNPVKEIRAVSVRSLKPKKNSLQNPRVHSTPSFEEVRKEKNTFSGEIETVEKDLLNNSGALRNRKSKGVRVDSDQDKKGIEPSLKEMEMASGKPSGKRIRSARFSHRTLSEYFPGTKKEEETQLDGDVRTASEGALGTRNLSRKFRTLSGYFPGIKKEVESQQDGETRAASEGALKTRIRSARLSQRFRRSLSGYFLEVKKEEEEPLFFEDDNSRKEYEIFKTYGLQEKLKCLEKIFDEEKSKPAKLRFLSSNFRAQYVNVSMGLSPRNSHEKLNAAYREFLLKKENNRKLL